jgi:hypothetical protein
LSTAIRAGTVILLLALLSGCAATAPGRIYTDITRPYTTNFDQTYIGEKHFAFDAHSVQEPFSGRGVTVEWSSGRIEELAAREGIEEIRYIEEQTLSILLGIYQRRRLIIYGD